MSIQTQKDLWRSLTVVACFRAIFLVPGGIASYLAAARWNREPAETRPPRRRRVDRRVPARFFAFGSTTLARVSYRLYPSCLQNPP